jgi:hypothetical protein
LDELKLIRMFGAVALAGLALFYLATYILSMLIGISAFIFTPEGLEVAKQFIQGIKLYILFDISVIIPAPLNIGVLFLVPWAVFWIALLVAWSGPSRSFHRSVKEGFNSPLCNLFKNYLIAFPMITTMLLVAEMTLQSFQEAVGIPTGSTAIANPYMLLFDASYAAITEEVGFRLIPIGTIVVLYIIWTGWRSLSTQTCLKRYCVAALAFLYPEGAKRRLKLKSVESAGWKGIGQAEWIIILVSALAFALAHVINGSGWELGKLTMTFMLGIVFGVVYIVYGITAPILMHWFHNYYLTALALSIELFAPPLTVFIEIVEISIIVVGIVGWAVLLAYLILRTLRAQEGGVGEVNPS